MALGSNRLRVEAEGLQTQVLEAPNITPTIFYQSKQVTGQAQIQVEV